MTPLNQAMDFQTSSIYRHFKGGYYVVQSVAESSEDESLVVVYQSLQNGQVWVRPYKEFIEEVPEGKENPTGQKYRFERITDFDNQLSLIPTGKLLRELLSRNDCPSEISIALKSDRVWKSDYLVGHYVTVPSYYTESGFVEDFDIESSFDTLEEAKSRAENNLLNTQIVERVFIKQDFD